MKLAGKLAWITGAGSGIGAAAAVALASEGATVVLSGRTRGKLEAVADGIGAQAHVIPCDVSVASEVEATAADILARFGRIDILVNNAGLNIPDRDWTRLSPTGVDAVIHTINMAECVNNIRSSVVLPGEVATPILDRRPVPVSAEDRARMVQAEDVGDLVLYIACLPERVVLNEVMIAPTWNRGYVAALSRGKS